MARIFDLSLSATHEAGHSLYGLLHYMRIDSVCIFENKKSKRVEGFTHYSSACVETVNDSNLIAYLVYSEICIKYAGLIAEKNQYLSMTGSDKFPAFLKTGSSDDNHSASDIIKRFNIVPAGKKRRQFKDSLIEETSQELLHYWDDVILVSHALFNDMKLTYQDLKKLLTKKSKQKVYWKEQFKSIDYIFSNTGSLDEKTLGSIILG